MRLTQMSIAVLKLYLMYLLPLLYIAITGVICLPISILMSHCLFHALVLRMLLCVLNY